MTTQAPEQTPDQKIEELLSRTKSLSELAEKLNEPQFTGARYGFDDAGGVLSYWGEEDAQPTVLHRDALRSKPKSMPKGYKGPGSVFKSFGNFLQSGMKSHREGDWQGRHASIFKAIEGMNETVGSDGGYLVPPEYASGILDREFSNDLWSRTDNYTIGGNGMIFTRNAETSRANGSRHGGVQGYWLGEGQTMPDTKPTLKEISLRLRKLAVVIFMTRELMDDAAAAEAHARKKAREEFNFMLGSAVFEGSGVGQPLGIHNSGALNVIAKESGQAAATIVSSNIDKMWARRLVRGGQYAWYHNQDCCPQLDNLAQDVGTGGVALYRPNGSIAGASLQTLKGAPRIETEFNETLGAQGDITLADLSQVLSISKAGITEEASIHVEFLTDQVALKFTMRVDCRPWEDTPLTPYKGSNTQSAFNVLAVRS